jgi:predicted DNA-binding protein YlxM (UPF0122 family)
MKRRGVATKYPKERIVEAISDYETSDYSWDEIAEKHNIPKTVLQYHRRKERKSESN